MSSIVVFYTSWYYVFYILLCWMAETYFWCWDEQRPHKSWKKPLNIISRCIGLYRLTSCCTSVLFFPGWWGSLIESGTQSDLKPMIRDKVCMNGWVLHFWFFALLSFKLTVVQSSLLNYSTTIHGAEILRDKLSPI